MTSAIRYDNSSFILSLFVLIVDDIHHTDVFINVNVDTQSLRTDQIKHEEGDICSLYRFRNNSRGTDVRLYSYSNHHPSHLTLYNSFYNDNHTWIKSFNSSIIKDYPDILITTPGRVSEHVKNKVLNLSELKLLVVDEADLIFSHGYADEMNMIKSSLPRVIQTLLFSATLDEVRWLVVKGHEILCRWCGGLTGFQNTDKLKKLMLRTPAVLQMKDANKGKLTEYYLTWVYF